MLYKRMPIEIESPEQMGYDTIRNNLSESSYTDALFRDIGISGDRLKELVLCYGSHMGHAGLRDLIVKDNTDLSRDDVLLTVGAAAGLFIIATALLEPGDELVVIRPNYATNIETPRAIGASIRFIDLIFEEGYALDMEAIRRAVTPATKYISVTYPHNPTGACLSDAEMMELVGIAEATGTRLLVDETYRDMVFGDLLPLAATYSDRVISVSSLSKAYGLPGIRMGWIICRDQQLMETFLAAKEQIHICGSSLDEEVAYHYLLEKDRHFARIRQDIRTKYGMVKDWMNRQDGFEWVEPKGGCVCCLRVRHPGRVDMDLFYKTLLTGYGTYVGPGHWFEMPDSYMRVGYGWPARLCLEEGLEALTKSLEKA
ncbi:MAG TPA: pyridoxal phosphate-dependent aminotransferase [Puia sp.]|nr:pyridoxal phosphate-dependent aminotransferase [Puia sp.]